MEHVSKTRFTLLKDVSSFRVKQRWSWRQERKREPGWEATDHSGPARDCVAWTKAGSGSEGRGSDWGHILQAGVVNGCEVECEGERELQGDSQVFQLSSYGTEWQSGAETDTRVGERKAGPVLSPGARPGLEPGKRWRKQRRRLRRTSR